MGDRSSDDLDSQEGSETQNSDTEVTDDKSDEEPAESQHPQTDRQLVSSAQSQQSGKPLPSFESLKGPIEEILATNQGSGFTDRAGATATYYEDLSTKHQGLADDFQTSNVVNVPGSSTGPGQWHERSVPSQSPSRSLTPMDRRQPSPSLQSVSSTEELCVLSPSEVKDEVGGPSPSSGPPSWSTSSAPPTPQPSYSTSPTKGPSSTTFPKGDALAPSTGFGPFTELGPSPSSVSPSWSIPSAPPTPQPSHSTSPTKRSCSTSFHTGDALTPSTGFGPFTELGPSPEALYSPSEESPLFLPYQHPLPTSETLTSTPFLPPYRSASSTPSPRPPPPPPPPYPYWYSTQFPPRRPPPPPYPSGRSTPLPPRPTPPPPPPYPFEWPIPLPPRPPPPSYPRRSPPPYRTPPHSGSLSAPSIDQANVQPMAASKTKGKYLCKTCGKTDDDKKKLRVHWVEQHYSSYCKYCNIHFNTIPEFHAHVIRVHYNSARVAQQSTPVISTQPSASFTPSTPHPTSCRSEISPPSGKMPNPFPTSQKFERSTSLRIPSRVQISPSESRPSVRSLPSSPSESSAAIRDSLPSIDQGNATNVQPFPPGDDGNESSDAFQIALAHIVIEHSYSARAGDLNTTADGTQLSTPSPPPSPQLTSSLSAMKPPSSASDDDMPPPSEAPDDDIPSIKMPWSSPPRPSVGRLSLTLLSRVETPPPESRPSGESLPLSPSRSSSSFTLSLPTRQLPLSLDQGATGLDAPMIEEHSYSARTAELNTPENRTRPSTPFRPPTPHPTSSLSEISPPSAKMPKPSPPIERFNRSRSLRTYSRAQKSPSQSRKSARSLPSSPSKSSTSTRFTFPPRQLLLSADQGATGLDALMMEEHSYSVRATGLNSPGNRTQALASALASLPPAYASLPPTSLPSSSRSQMSPPSEEIRKRGRPLGKSKSLVLPSRARTSPTVKSAPRSAQSSPRSPYSCLTCNYETTSLEKLRIHRKTHLEYHCQLCDTYYCKSERLNNHIRKIHENKKKFSIQCQHCNDIGNPRTFNTIKDLKSHVEKEVIPTPEYYCPICGKFNSNGPHMRRHYANLGDEHYDVIPDLDYNKKNKNKKKDDDGDGGAGGGQQLSVNYLELNNNIPFLEKYLVDKSYDYITTEMEKMLKVSSKSYSGCNKIGKEKGPHFVIEVQNTKQKLAQARTLALTACSECNFPKLLKRKKHGKATKNSNPRVFVCKKCGKRFRRKKLLKLHCSKFCHIKGHSCR